MLVPYWIRRYFADNYHTPECWVVEEMSQNENIKEAESSGNNCLEKLKFYVTFSAAIVGKGRVQKKIKKVWNFPPLGWLIHKSQTLLETVTKLCVRHLLLFCVPLPDPLRGGPRPLHHQPRLRGGARGVQSRPQQIHTRWLYPSTMWYHVTEN